MRGTTLSIQTNTTFVVEECCTCGVLFAMTDEMKRFRLADKQTFYCTNGHGQSYTGKTDAQKLKEAERERANAEEQARIEAARAKQAEDELKRLRKRAAAGVCPCCNRSFVQLARHMKAKHPDHAA